MKKAAYVLYKRKKERRCFIKSISSLFTTIYGTNSTTYPYNFSFAAYCCVHKCPL